MARADFFEERGIDQTFHMGRLIKEEMLRQGRKATWLAKQVHCTPENIYKVFRQRWVTMHLLFDISRVLDYDFFKVCSDYLEVMMDFEIQEENEIDENNVNTI